MSMSHEGPRAQPASLCGSSVFLWFLGPSWCFSGSKECHLELFFEPRGSLGRCVEGLGVPLGGFGAQSLLKNVSLFHARYLSSDVGAKMGTGKVSKRSQKVNKKTIQNSINKSMRFGIAFYWIFVDVWCQNCLKFHKNHDPHTYQSKKAEGCKVL